MSVESSRNTTDDSDVDRSPYLNENLQIRISCNGMSSGVILNHVYPWEELNCLWFKRTRFICVLKFLIIKAK